MESRRRSLGNRETLRLPAQQDEERVPPAMLVRVGVLGVLIVALCVLILRMGGGADEAPPVSDQPAPAWESVSGPTAHAPIPIAFLTFFIGIGVVGMVASSLGIFRPVAPGRRPRLDTKVGLFGLGLLGAGYALLITTSWNPTEKLEAQRRRPPPVFDAPSSAAAIPGPADDSPAGSPDTAHPAWTEVVGSLPEIPEPEVPDPVFTGLFDVLLPESAARRAGGSVEGPSCASRMDSLPAFSRLACRLEVREPLPGIDPTFRSLLASVMPKPQPPAQAAAAPSAATVESRKEAAPEAAKEVPEAPAPKAPADAAPRQQEQPPKVAAAPTAPPPPDARPPEPPMLSRDEVMRAWRLGALRLMAQVFLLGLLVGGIIAFLLRLLVRLYERQARLT